MDPDGPARTGVRRGCHCSCDPLLTLGWGGLGSRGLPYSTQDSINVSTKEKGEFVDNIGAKQNFPGNFVSETSRVFNVVSKPA